LIAGDLLRKRCTNLVVWSEANQLAVFFR
jgi:hypothetical protein